MSADEPSQDRAAALVRPGREGAGPSLARTAHQMLQHAREKAQEKFDKHYPDIVAGNAAEHADSIKQALTDLSFLRTYFTLEMSRNWHSIEGRQGESVGIKAPVPLAGPKVPLLVTLQSLHDEAEEIVMHVEADRFVEDYVNDEAMQGNFALVLDIAARRVRQQAELWEAQLLQRAGGDKDPFKRVYADPTLQKLRLVQKCLEDCKQRPWAPKGGAQPRAEDRRNFAQVAQTKVKRGKKEDRRSEEEIKAEEQARRTAQTWAEMYMMMEGTKGWREPKWQREQREAQEALDRHIAWERSRKNQTGNTYAEVINEVNDRHARGVWGPQQSMSTGMFTPSTRDGDVGVEPYPAHCLGGSGSAYASNQAQAVNYVFEATYSHGFKKKLGVHLDLSSDTTVDFFNRVEQTLPGLFELHLTTTMGKFRLSVRPYARWKHTLVEPFLLVADSSPLAGSEQDWSTEVKFREPEITYSPIQLGAKYAIYGRGNEIDGMVQALRYAHEAKPEWFSPGSVSANFVNGMFSELSTLGARPPASERDDRKWLYDKKNDFLKYSCSYYSTDSAAVRNLGSLGETSTFIWNLQGAVFGVRMFTKSINKLWYLEDQMPHELQLKMAPRAVPRGVPQGLGVTPEQFVAGAPHSTVLITQVLQKLLVLEGSMRAPWQRAEQDLDSREYLVTPEKKIDWMFHMMLKRASLEGGDDKESLFRIKKREGSLQTSAEVLRWRNGVYHKDMEKVPDRLLLKGLGEPMELQLDARQARQSGVVLYRGGAQVYCEAVFLDGFRERQWRWILDMGANRMFKEYNANTLTEFDDHPSATGAREAQAAKWRGLDKQVELQISVPEGAQSVERGLDARDGDYCAYFTRNDAGAIVMLHSEVSRDLELPDVHGPARETYYLRMYNEFSMVRSQTDYNGKVPKFLSVRVRQVERSEQEVERTLEEQRKIEEELMNMPEGPDKDEKILQFVKNSRRKVTVHREVSDTTMQFHAVDTETLLTYRHSRSDGAEYFLTGYYLEDRAQMTWGLQFKPVGEDPYFIAHMEQTRGIHFEVEGLYTYVPRSQALVQALDAGWNWLYHLNGGTITSEDWFYTVEVTVPANTGWFRRASNHTAFEGDIRAGRADYEGTTFAPFTPDEWSALLRADKYQMNYYSNILMGKQKKARDNGGEKKEKKKKKAKKVQEQAEGGEAESSDDEDGVEESTEKVAEAQAKQADMDKRVKENVERDKQNKQNKGPTVKQKPKEKVKRPEPKPKDTEELKLLNDRQKIKTQIFTVAQRLRDMLSDIERLKTKLLKFPRGSNEKQKENIQKENTRIENEEIKPKELEYENMKETVLKKLEEEKINIEKELKDRFDYNEAKFKSYDKKHAKIDSQEPEPAPRLHLLGAPFAFVGGNYVSQEQVRDYYLPYHEMKVWDKATLAHLLEVVGHFEGKTKPSQGNVPAEIHMYSDYLNGASARRLAQDTANPVQIDPADSTFVLVSTQGPVYLSQNGMFMLSPYLHEDKGEEESQSICWALFRWYKSEGIYQLLARKHGHEAKVLLDPGADKRKAGSWQFFGQFKTEKRIEPEALNNYGTRNTKVVIEVDNQAALRRLQAAQVSDVASDRNNPLRLMQRYPDVMLRVKDAEEALREKQAAEAAQDDQEDSKPLDQRTAETAARTKKKAQKGLWGGCIIVPDCSKMRTPWYALRYDIYNYMFEEAERRRVLYDHREDVEVDVGSIEANPWDAMAEKTEMEKGLMIDTEELQKAVDEVAGLQQFWGLPSMYPGASDFFRKAFVYSAENVKELVSSRSENLLMLPVFLMVQLPVVQSSTLNSRGQVTRNGYFIFYLSNPSKNVNGGLTMEYESVNWNLKLSCVRHNRDTYKWQLTQTYKEQTNDVGGYTSHTILLAEKMRYPGNLYHPLGSSKGPQMNWRWKFRKGIYREYVMKNIKNDIEKNQAKEYETHYYSDIFVQNINPARYLYSLKSNVKSTYRHMEQGGGHLYNLDVLDLQTPITLAKSLKTFDDNAIDSFFNLGRQNHPVIWKYKETKKVEDFFFMADCPLQLTLQIETQFKDNAKEVVCVLQNEEETSKIVWKSSNPFVRIQVKQDAQDYTAFRSFFLTVEYDSDTSNWVLCVVGAKSVLNSETELMDLVIDPSVKYKLFNKDPELDISMGINFSGVPFTFKSLLSMDMGKSQAFTINNAEKERLIRENSMLPTLWPSILAKMKLKTDRGHDDQHEYITMTLLFDKEEIMFDVTPRINKYISIRTDFRTYREARARPQQAPWEDNQGMQAGFSMGGIWADFEDDGLDQSRRRLYEEW